MDKNEIAKDLALQLLQNPSVVIPPDAKLNPSVIGKHVADLYNSILDNLKA